MIRKKNLRIISVSAIATFAMLLLCDKIWTLSTLDALTESIHTAAPSRSYRNKIRKASSVVMNAGSFRQSAKSLTTDNLDSTMENPGAFDSRKYTTENIRFSTKAESGFIDQPKTLTTQTRSEAESERTPEIPGGKEDGSHQRVKMDSRGTVDDESRLENVSKDIVKDDTIPGTREFKLSKYLLSLPQTKEMQNDLFVIDEKFQCPADITVAYRKAGGPGQSMLDWCQKNKDEFRVCFTFDKVFSRNFARIC